MTSGSLAMVSLTILIACPLLGPAQLALSIVTSMAFVSHLAITILGGFIQHGIEKYLFISVLLSNAWIPLATTVLFLFAMLSLLLAASSTTEASVEQVLQISAQISISTILMNPTGQVAICVMTAYLTFFTSFNICKYSMPADRRTIVSALHLVTALALVFSSCFSGLAADLYQLLTPDSQMLDLLHESFSIQSFTPSDSTSFIFTVIVLSLMYSLIPPFCSFYLERSDAKNDQQRERLINDNAHTGTESFGETQPWRDGQR